MTKFKRKNTILQFALAAVLSGGSFAANAAFIKADGTAWVPAQAASELPTTGLDVTHAAGGLAAGATTTTFTPAAGQSLRIDVTLTGGATFKTAPQVTCYGGSTTAIVPAPMLGGAGSNQAVYSLSTAHMTAGGAGATAAGALSACFISALDLTLTTGAHSNITESITFTYGSLASSTVNDTLLAFQSGLTASITVGTDVVAQVTSGFMSLSGGSTLLSAGLITWTGDGSAGVTALGTPIALSNALGATSGSITISGASLAAAKTTAGVFLTSAASDCTSASVYSVTGGATSVTFTGVTPAHLAAGLHACVQFSGTTAIPAGSITATVGGTAVSGWSLPTVAAQNLVSVTRNGTTLIAPLVNVPSGWISRLVLVNRGSGAANYTVTAVSESGTTVTLTGAGASGTLTAGSNAVIDLSSTMTTVGSARGSLQVVVDGVAANIDGLYQLVNAATGNLSSYTLINK